jgi:hypothetical protein
MSLVLRVCVLDHLRVTASVVEVVPVGKFARLPLRAEYTPGRARCPPSSGECCVATRLIVLAPNPPSRYRNLHA